MSESSSGQDRSGKHCAASEAPGRPRTANQRRSGVHCGSAPCWRTPAAGYGTSAEFRHGLDERGLTWAVGIPRTQKVYTTAVGLRWPWAARGRPRQVPVPNKEPRAVEQVLGGARWRRMVWRRGKKGALAARFVALRIRVGDGPITRPSRNLPGHAVWLAGEWRGNGQRKCHLSSLPADAPLRDPAAAIKARWVCEQAHQQLKQELGLGHSEGRSWTGLRRHALMACIAFAYLQHPRFEAVHSRGKRRKPLTAGGPPPQPSLPAVRRADMARLFARLAGQVRCPHCYRKAADGARP